MSGSLIYKKKRSQVFREMVTIFLLVLADKVAPQTIDGIKMKLSVRKIGEQLEDRGNWIWDNEKKKGLF